MQSKVPEIASWFGIDPAGAPIHPPDVDESMLPRAGEIVLISGPSGAGKTSLLRALRKRFARARRWIGISSVPLPRCAIVDCFGRLSAQDTLKLLSRVGLAEASLFALRPDQLSEGQRFRLRLARSLYSADRAGRKQVTLWCDEFAAPLDEITAAVAAAAVRRAIWRDEPRCGAIFATGREALIAPLEPDVIVRCDFGSWCVEGSGLGFGVQGPGVRNQG